MAALESVAYPFALHSCTSFTFLYSPAAPPSRRLSARVQFSSFARHLSVASLGVNHYTPARKFCFKLCSAVQETAAETKPEETQNANLQTKLYVVNLPFPSTAEDIRDLFAQCGTVTDVEIIRREDGRSKGFAFVTMASLAEAQAAVDKLDSHEVSGRIIRVEFAKQFKKPSPTSPPAAFKKPSPTSPPAAAFKKPSPPSPPDVTAGETAHKLYVSNLAWKVRSGHLREFFSGDSTPVSASVVFSGPGKAAGYGFVSFATREEAEAALSTLNGKELMGRPLRLKFSEKKVEESGGEKKEEDNSQGKPEQE